ncbi:MAG: hypothetical protein ABR501_15500, partial [Pyrinomonadaceae bacterium]
MSHKGTGEAARVPDHSIEVSRRHSSLGLSVCSIETLVRKERNSQESHHWERLSEGPNGVEWL